MKAQLCPVCHGSGKYTGDKCHGCNGKGWVQVPEDRLVVFPRYPRPGPMRGRPPAHSYLAH